MQKIRAGLVLAVISFVLCCSVATSASSAGASGTIAREHWAYKAIDNWAQRGLIADYPVGPFSGPAKLTRFEMASLTLRALEGIGREYERQGVEIVQLANPSFATEKLPTEAEARTEAEAKEKAEAAAATVERGPGISPEDFALLEKMVAEFRTELAEMGTKVDKLETLLASTRQRLEVVESNLRQHQISGYIQFRFSDDKAKANSTFFIRRARLSVSGPISPKVSYKIQLQLEKNSGSQVAIRDAYIDMVTGKESRLRAGQAVLPIGYELTEPDPDRLDPERAFMMDRLFPDQRDIGVQWRWQKKAATPALDLAVVNGNGINTTDENDRKDVIAAVNAPLSFGSATFAIYNGRSSVGDDATAKDRLVAGIDIGKKKTELRSEYISGKDRGEDVRGWYARLSQRMTKSGTSFVKYDAFDENLDRSDDLFQRWTLGWVEQLDKNVRLTLAWEKRSPGRNFSERSSFKGNLTMVQLQVKF
jgi:hypothetical protein